MNPSVYFISLLIADYYVVWFYFVCVCGGVLLLLFLFYMWLKLCFVISRLVNFLFC